MAFSFESHVYTKVIMSASFMPKLTDSLDYWKWPIGTPTFGGKPLVDGCW